jgi:thioester reductase-like protein
MGSLIDGPVQKILLTGATGYLGTHLLAGLLESRDISVRCLVRAENAVKAKERVVHSLEQFMLWKPEWSQRLDVIAADLGEAFLGLTQAEFIGLGKDVDVIIHNGASVNYVLSYEQLKGVNVNGTQELLRLAEDTRIPFVYVSTLRLFDSRFDGVPITELDKVDEKGTTYAGYSRSKWMAEKLINLAGRRGLPFLIVRPGLICGDEVCGIPNVNDAVARLVKGCVEIGLAPLSALQVNLTPIHYVVKGVIGLLYHHNSSGKVFHLVNDKPTRCDDIMHTLKDMGYGLQLLAYDEWTQRLRDSAATGNNFLLPLLQYFDADLPRQSQQRLFDSQYTQSYLAHMGIEPSPVTIKMLRKNIEGMIKFGFISAPNISAHA